jgi:hypothetical protein
VQDVAGIFGGTVSTVWIEPSNPAIAELERYVRSRDPDLEWEQSQQILGVKWGAASRGLAAC